MVANRFMTDHVVDTNCLLDDLFTVKSRTPFHVPANIPRVYAEKEDILVGNYCLCCACLYHEHHFVAFNMRPH